MRIITKLLRSLEKGDLYDSSTKEVSSVIFDSLLATTTLRIVTNAEFYNAAYDIAVGRPQPDHLKRRVWAGHWWFEKDDIAFWCKGMTSDGGLNTYIIKEDNLGRIRVLNFLDPPLGELRVLEPARGAGMILPVLMALEQVPEKLIHNVVQPLSVPKTLRDTAPKDVLFNTVYFRGHRKNSKGEHSVLDISGCRWHYVREHIRPSTGKTVKLYWRGDPSLGVVRKIYIAKEAMP